MSALMACIVSLEYDVEYPLLLPSGPAAPASPRTGTPPASPPRD